MVEPLNVRNGGVNRGRLTLTVDLPPGADARAVAAIVETVRIAPMLRADVAPLVNAARPLLDAAHPHSLTLSDGRQGRPLYAAPLARLARLLPARG